MKVALYVFLLGCGCARADLEVHSHYSRPVYVVSGGTFYYVTAGEISTVPISADYGVFETDGSTVLGTRTWVEGDNEVHVWGVPGVGGITTINGAGVAYWFTQGLYWGVVWGVYGMTLRFIGSVGRTSSEL